MATEKKKSPLYDNERSKRDREAAATAEADMERGDKPRADAKAEKHEAGESEGLKKADSGADMLMEGLRAIHKSHEAERRDMHGNHREAHRQMMARHEKQIRDHYDKHMSKSDSAVGNRGVPGAISAVSSSEPMEE